MSSTSQSSSNSCANQPRVIRKRVVANKRERERTKSLNQALETLRNRLPVSETEKRSKIQTLRVAKEYIEFLANVTKLERIEKLEKFEYIAQPENNTDHHHHQHHQQHDLMEPITTTTNSTPIESRQYECTYEKSPVKQQPDSPLTYKFYKFRLKSHSRDTRMNFYNTAEAQQDGDVNVAPDDTVSALAFSPQRQLQSDFIVSGTWGNTVSCYQVAKAINGQYKGELKASHQHQGAVLDVCWSDDCTKVFSASADKTVKMWDLSSNQQTPVAMHDAPIRTVHWIKASNYTCIMTSSWDRTLKFWDTRSPTPLTSISLPERAYCADVLGPMAVVSTADRAILIYKLEPSPTLIKSSESPFKFQHKCVSIFTDEKTREPSGYALGSIEGRVAVQYVQQKDPKSNFTFKCHRPNGQNTTIQDIYAVNDIAFHPVHGTMVTIGSDGKYSFWDKDARTRLKISDQFESPLTRCSINSTGEIFAYATGYDWSKGHEYSQPQATKNKIQFHYCFEELKPKKKT